jgi:hypothetical protein
MLRENKAALRSLKDNTGQQNYGYLIFLTHNLYYLPMSLFRISMADSLILVPGPNIPVTP